MACRYCPFALIWDQFTVSTTLIYSFKVKKAQKRVQRLAERIFENQEPGRGSQYVDFGIISCIIIVNMGLYLHETAELDAVLCCLQCAPENCAGSLSLF